MANDTATGENRAEPIVEAQDAREAQRMTNHAEAQLFEAARQIARCIQPLGRDAQRARLSIVEAVGYGDLSRLAAAVEGALAPFEMDGASFRGVMTPDVRASAEAWLARTKGFRRDSEVTDISSRLEIEQANRGEVAAA